MSAGDLPSGYGDVRFLPYAHSIDEEAEQQSQLILHNLNSVVAESSNFRLVRYWLDRLNQYIYIQGNRFHLQDHISLVKLVYGIMVMPKLDVTSTMLSCKTLHNLLEGQLLKLRGHFYLDWRPLFDLFVSITEQPSHALEHFQLNPPYELTVSIYWLVRSARDYFGPFATKEILHEHPVSFYPFDMKVNFLNLRHIVFLPTRVKACNSRSGFEMWFETLVQIWISMKDKMDEVEECANFILDQLASIAWENIGLLDWEKYLPRIFEKLSMCLPKKDVFPYYGDCDYSSRDDHREWSAATLIVALLAENSTCIEYLTRFLDDAAASMAQASRLGSHGAQWIVYDIAKVTYYRILVERRQENVRQGSDGDTRVGKCYMDRFCLNSVKLLEVPRINKIPEQSMLMNSEQLTRLVANLVKCTRVFLFQKDVILSLTASTTWLLCQIEPAAVVTNALLESANEKNRTNKRLLSALLFRFSGAALAIIRNPSVRYTTVLDVLSLCESAFIQDDADVLPAVFNLVYTMSLYMTFCDYSRFATPEPDPQLSAEEVEFCSKAFAVEEFVIDFVNKSLAFVTNVFSPSAVAEENDHEMNGGESPPEPVNLSGTPELKVLKRFFYFTINMVISQCSPQLIKGVVFELGRNMHRAPLKSLTEVELLATIISSSCMIGDDSYGTSSFLPHACFEIKTASRNHFSELNKETPEPRAYFALSLLAQCLVCNGKHLIPYQTTLLETFQLLKEVKNIKGTQLIGEAIRNVLGSLMGIYYTEKLNDTAKKVLADYKPGGGNFFPVPHWGTHEEKTDDFVQWHFPNEKEIEFANILINDYIISALRAVNESSASESEIEIQLILLAEAIPGICSFTTWNESALPLYQSDQTIPSVVYQSGIPEEIQKLHGELRTKIATLLVSLTDKLRQQGIISPFIQTKLLDLYKHLMFTFELKSGHHEWCVHVNESVPEIPVGGSAQTDCSLQDHGIPMALIDRDSRVCDLSNVYLEFHRRQCSHVKDMFSKSHVAMLKDVCLMCRSSDLGVCKKSFAILRHALVTFPDCYVHFLGEATYIACPDEHCSDDVMHERVSFLLSTEALSQDHPLWLTLIWFSTILLEGPGKHRAFFEITDGQEGVWLDESFRFFSLEFTNPSRTPNTKATIMKDGDFDRKGKRQGISKSNVEIQDLNRKTAFCSLAIELTNVMLTSTLSVVSTILALRYLRFLVLADCPLDETVIKSVVSNIYNENWMIQDAALSCLTCILVKVSPPREPRTTEAPEDFDNSALFYTAEKLPIDQYQWEELAFDHYMYDGFQINPRRLELHTSANTTEGKESKLTKLPKLQKIINQSLMEVRTIDEFMIGKFETTNPLLKASIRSLIYHAIRDLDRELLNLFFPTIQRDINKPVCSGLIRATRHWSYQDVEAFWGVLLPFLYTNPPSADEVRDILTERDPRSVYWLIEFVVESFTYNSECELSQERVNAVINLLRQCAWRSPELHQRIYDKFLYFKRLSSCRLDFVSGFLTFLHYDAAMCFGKFKEYIERPSVSEILEFLLEELQAVKGNKYNTEAEYSRTMESISRIVIGCMQFPFRKFNPKIFLFLPDLATAFLKTDCACLHSEALYFLATTKMTANNANTVLDMTARVLNSTVAQVVRLGQQFLITYVESNVTYLRLAPEVVVRVGKTVLTLLVNVDQWVQRQAALLLRILFQFDLLAMDDELLKFFTEMAYTETNDSDPAALRVRYAGVLALAAYIQAHPYDMAPYMTEVLMEMYVHESDPKPIRPLVRKVLRQFRNSHLTMWQEHRDHFKGEQSYFLRLPNFKLTTD